MNKYAIIVTYHPDFISLKKLCDCIELQDFKIIIVDNTGNNAVLTNFFSQNIQIIALEDNKGIAFAQNLGVKKAINCGAEIISFFDQDSEINESLLYKLSEPYRNGNLAVTAPVIVNKKDGLEYPSQVFNWFGYPKNIYAKNEKLLVPVDIVISSGTVIPVKVFELIGIFDEDFFIDFVDIEWCIRCRNKGIVIYVVPGALMEHSIGDSSMRVGCMQIVLHNPVRTYYKVRNSLLLLRKDIKILFSLRQVAAAIVHNIVLSLCVRQKKLYFTYVVKGFIHGVLGKTGKYKL